MTDDPDIGAALDRLHTSIKARMAELNDKDATITRLRAELAASAVEHSRSAEQFAFYVEMTHTGVLPNPAEVEVHAHRCAATAKRAREAANG